MVPKPEIRLCPEDDGKYTQACYVEHETFQRILLYVDTTILGIHFEFMRHPRTASRIAAMLMRVLLFCIETQALLDWFG